MLDRVQRTKQRVLVQPPAFAIHECLQPLRAGGPRPPLVGQEQIERRPEHAGLQRADGRILDRGRLANRLEQLPLARVEERLRAESVELRHARRRDEDRIDRHRAER